MALRYMKKFEKYTFWVRSPPNYQQKNWKVIISTKSGPLRFVLISSSFYARMA